MKVVRTASGESAGRWGSALEDRAWLADSQSLKRDNGAWVRRATVLGHDVVVKCRPLNTLARRLKSAIGVGHAHKHWRGAARLMRANIPTGRPLVVCRADVDGAPCELLVLEFVPGKSLLRVLDEITRGVGPPVREQHDIARAVGRQIGLLGRTIHNRDHKPSNLVVTTSENGGRTIAIIDCVGVFRPIVWRRAPAILKHLVIEPLGCDVLPRRSLRARVVQIVVEGMWRGPLPRDSVRALRRSIWGKTWSAVLLHETVRPLVNPLATSRPASPVSPPGPAAPPSRSRP